MKFIFRTVEDYVTIHAAYTTLFLFMSLFPLCMFILNLLSLINVDKAVLERQVLYFIPDAFDELIKSVINNISDNSSGLILSISVVSSTAFFVGPSPPSGPPLPAFTGSWWA